MTAEYVRLGPASDVPEPGNKAFDVDGTSVLVCRVGGEVYALANQCSHAAMPLEGGRVRGVHLFCPSHGARFDLRDGSTKGTLTSTPVKTFPAKIEDGTIYIQLA